MKERGRKGTRTNLYDVSLCEDTYPNPKNSGTKALKERQKHKSQGFGAGFHSDNRDGRVWQRCRRVGGHMEDTSLKFGGWGLCRTRGRASAVKATENKKWMERKKTKNPAKRGVRKKRKKKLFLVGMVCGGIDRSTPSRWL
jgi:hypothetical protein